VTTTRCTARLIAFEGCDASGKTTQARLLADRIGALWTREPGDTPAGARIRSLLLDHSPEGASLHPRTEALLMAADRAQHVTEVIEPALASGRHVVTDRFLASSVAYQGAARALGTDDVRRLSLWATAGRVPDLTVLLRVTLDVALRRLRAAGQPDRLESEGRDFLATVMASYDEQARAGGDRWVVIDGDAPIEIVAERVASAVGSFLDASTG
jgi:dTMP kinase